LTRAFFTPIFLGLKNVTVFEADVKGKHNGVIGLWRLYNELKALNVNAVADLHNVLRSNILKRFFQLGGIPFKQIDKGRSEKKALTEKEKKTFVQLKSTHQRYADVFTDLGYTISLSPTTVLKKKTLPEKVMKILGQNHLKWVGIAPFAAYSGKMYPLNLMEEVVAKLNDSNRYILLLFGGGDKEKELLNSWESRFNNSKCLVGKLPFEDELALISNLDVMLSMDSGNAHLASMYGVPTITLWGVTHPFAGFTPFGQEPENSILADRTKYPLIPTSIYGNKYPPGYEKVMETISTTKVVEKVQQILNV